MFTSQSGISCPISKYCSNIYSTQHDRYKKGHENRALVSRVEFRLCAYVK